MKPKKKANPNSKYGVRDPEFKVYGFGLILQTSDLLSKPRTTNYELRILNYKLQSFLKPKFKVQGLRFRVRGCAFGFRFWSAFGCFEYITLLQICLQSRTFEPHPAASSMIFYSKSVYKVTREPAESSQKLPDSMLCCSKPVCKVAFWTTPGGFQHAILHRTGSAKFGGSRPVAKDVSTSRALKSRWGPQKRARARNLKRKGSRQISLSISGWSHWDNASGIKELPIAVQNRAFRTRKANKSLPEKRKPGVLNRFRLLRIYHAIPNLSESLALVNRETHLEIRSHPLDRGLGGR